jgi:hypothetical protein
MPEVVAFKSGKDLEEESRADEAETVACVDCGAVESDEVAYQNGWQLASAVCPDCLRWAVVGEEACCAGRPSWRSGILLPSATSALPGTRNVRCARSAAPWRRRQAAFSHASASARRAST